jgi:methylamine--corrinoid protein Co-methyltransferase
MLSLLDIAERTHTGPKMSEMDWDMGLFAKMTELAQRYEIRVPTEIDWFNVDARLAGRALQAAIDFLVDKGVYCLSTGRVVQFSREEVLAALREAPDAIEIGEGSDRRVVKQRRVEGREPLNVCPGHHAPFDLDLAPLVVENWARLARADFLEGFNFTQVDGHEIRGLPLEAHATRRQVEVLRHGIREAGRPGLAVALYPISTQAGAMLAALDPDFGLRRTDGMLLSILPDLKLEHDLLTAAMVGHDYGLFSISCSYSLVGGFCGGVEGALIEAIAQPIAAWMVYRDELHYVGVMNMPGSPATSLQPTSWASSVVFQALNTHTPTICMQGLLTRSGPGTEASLIEIAIKSIEGQINGGNLYVTRHSKPQINAGQTPLEAEWMIEVADATLRAGLDRSGAARICRALHEPLKGRKSEPGRHICDCYDLLHHRPLPDYERIYRQLKDDLSALGLDFA